MTPVFALRAALMGAWRRPQLTGDSLLNHSGNGSIRTPGVRRSRRVIKTRCVTL